MNLSRRLVKVLFFGSSLLNNLRSLLVEMVTIVKCSIISNYQVALDTSNIETISKYFRYIVKTMVKLSFGHIGHIQKKAGVI